MPTRNHLADEVMMVDNSNMPRIPQLTEEIEELSLLLPSWQVMALAERAESQGLTVAQFMRALVNQALVSRIPA
jgi:hypothetical protein